MRCAIPSYRLALFPELPDAEAKFLDIIPPVKCIAVLGSLNELIALSYVCVCVLGESDKWVTTVNTTEENRVNYCKVLMEKTLFTPLYGTYTVALNELKAVLKVSRLVEQPN
jgi:hypothetical protein